MDKRSIFGLLIIGAILFAFSYFNADKVSGEVSKNDDKDSTEVAEDTTNTSSESETFVADNVELIPLFDEDSVQLQDSMERYGYYDPVADIDTFIAVSNQAETVSAAPESNQPAANAVEKTVRIENDLLAVDISNKGGRIVNVLLKKYQNYESFIGGDNNPLRLFDRQSTYGISFFEGDNKRNSADYDFRFIEESDNAVTVEMINKFGKKVGFKYAVKEGKYDLDFSIYFKGFGDRDAEDLMLTSDFKLLSTEKHLESEQRVSTVFFKYKEDSYDYLSEASNDDEALEEKTEWVAFKQSYFSAILMNENGFDPTNSKVEIETLDESDTTYIKRYLAELNLGVTNTNNTVDLNWYFGPNDYNTLAEYDNGSEDIVNLGWGLFRWINVYFMKPIFNALMNWGIGAGLAILLLTIFVKLLLSPINYKMYKSSAMMKVLRPEIEKIGKKFPKKEDAVKKQQETMALYRETGVSPMAGCIPMLIQMPILFAIFRLFPAEISLRQKGFLWAEDLSTYDAIVNLGFDIPFYGDHVSLFTLLMAGTTLLYTHYNSSNMQQPTMEGMPNMKYIMYFFPIMMIFFFNSYSSGLSYYYFISTLMTIGIMFSIKRFMLDEDKIQEKIESNRKDPKKKKGKSKFQQRLEEAQRLQQERIKNKK